MNALPRQAGFSLVEVLCAILILGFGIAGITQGITTALISSKESEVQTIAAGLAAGQIELLRAEGYFYESETEGKFAGALDAYAWRQLVRQGNIEGLYEVHVIILNASTDQEIFELSTMLFDPPLTERQEPDARERERERQRSNR